MRANLKRFFCKQAKLHINNAAMNAPPKKPAHLIIDAHRAFCDPAYRGGYGTAETLNAVRNIERLSAHFRRASVPNYFIYLPAIFGLAMKRGALLIEPAAQDRQVWKWRDSAFSFGRIHSHLRREEVGTLLVSGFNRAACVLKTVEDALKRGYEVYLMHDAVEDDKRFKPKHKDWALARMTEKGAKIIDTETAIRLFPA